ncbi:MAG: hypothetical protein KJN93_00705 [Alphaproteobacteria bacterium]|nr:hypothetical protein [Alphaproteobacteria bacterium]NNF23853.1 hypothetical protein [Paracoccaceae bacterium]
MSNPSDKKPAAPEEPCGGRAVHSDPKAPRTPEQVPLPAGVSKKPLDQKSPAEWAYERLILYIQNFEAQLDTEHEIAIGIADGGAGLLRIEGMGFFDPDIVTFYGTDPSGARSQLIQHVTQLNVTLRALTKEMPEAEPRRIGFRLAAELGGGTDTASEQRGTPEDG